MKTQSQRLLIFAAFSVLIIGIIQWTIDLLYAQALEQALTEPQPLTDIKPEVVKQPQIAIAKVNLPSLPKRSENSVSGSASTKMSHSPPAPLAKQMTKANTTYAKKNNDAGQGHSEIAQNQQSTHEIEQTSTASSVYEQLTQDTSLELELVWPNNGNEREQLFSHFYQCVGAQFAVLEREQLTYLSPKRYNQPSQWLRIAHGQLSQQEQRWLANSKVSGTPVRLVPQDVDFALSQHIANALKNSELKSLRGEYQLTNGILILTNIRLNGKPMDGEWAIHRGTC
jgi:hypothetical protein